MKTFRLKHWQIVPVMLLLGSCLGHTSLKAQEKQSEVIFLSGEDFEHPKEWEFMCTGGMKSDKWGKINVPSQWELQGYGEYTYGRWYKELNLKEPSKEEGYYKLSFDVPENYENKHIELVFEGVMTDTEVTLNGQSVGEKHQGGFYRFMFDVTSYIKAGESNLLEVHVYKHSANHSVNRAERYTDWWLFGGIYRPVKLVASPKTHIERLALDPKADGTLNSEIFIKGLEGKAELEISVASTDGQTHLGTQSFKLDKATEKVLLTSNWENVKSWDIENPNLYDVLYTLKENGEIIHQKKERIGFRTLEFKKRDGIYLNGIKLLVKGVNRHTFWPESGRSTSKRISILDAELIKDMNINTVRGHYPPDDHFLDVCDSVGLLVMNELAGWQNGYDDKVGEILIHEMISRDVNHPSVLTWAQGNEGGWNYKLDYLFDELDPQKRIVIHPWSDFNGWDTHHYPAYQTGVHRLANGENVFLPTEFMHGMYDQGHGAGLQDFWENWKKSPLFAGAVMWAYSDEAVLRTDWKGDRKFDSAGNLAPDGILGPHREKEGSYFTVKEVWSPIQFKPRMITPSFDGTFLVSNEFLFTNLNQCTLKYKVASASSKAISDGNVNLLTKGEIDMPDIKPGETRHISIPVGENFFEGDWVEIEAFDKTNHLICKWTWPIHRANYYAEKFMPQNNKSNKNTITLEGAKASLSVKNVTVQLDTLTGYIASITRDGKKVPFGNGPIPIGMQAAVDHISIDKKEGHESLIIHYKGGIDNIRWTITSEGILKMDMTALKQWRNDGGFDGAVFENNINKFGISFDYPEEGVEGIRWFGRGPYRVWKNRIPGTNYGVWEKEYNNTITGESFENLIYPEFKGYHAHLFWANIMAGENSFSVASASDGVFLRLFTPEEPNHKLTNRSTQPGFPVGDISFMYEIPAIWAFKPIPHQGPQSQPTSIRIKSGDEGIRMKLDFDFRSKK